MDTSSEYIKMCEKAEEIQRLFSWSDNEFVAVDGKPLGRVFEYQYLRSNHSVVWLPRQDQLQKMVEDRFSTREILPCLRKLVDFSTNTFSWPRKSWEQLWFAFVMKEKFNKTWNGEEWISDKG